jgi:hypothetical protein
MFAVLLIFVAVANAAHDHSLHPDKDFISGECTRTAYNNIRSITKEMNGYLSDMEFIEN